MIKLRFLLVAIVLVSSCVDSVPPTDPLTTRENRLSEEFYYLHQNERVHLDIDPSAIIIQSPAAESKVIQILNSFGARTSWVDELPQKPQHRVYHLESTADALIRAVTALRLNGQVQFAAPAFRTRTDGTRVFLLNQLDVAFIPGTSDGQIESFNQQFGTTVISPPKPDSGYTAWRLAMRPGADPLKTAQHVSTSPIVHWVDIDKVAEVAPFHVPNDPYYPLQFHLRNNLHYNGVPVDINVEAAWDLTRGNGLVEIAIIDDGVDFLHGNSGGGYQGDLSSGQLVGNAIDYVNAPGEGNAYQPCCDDVHGTAMAGIAMASQDNSLGGSGVAPNTRLNSVRIFRRTPPSPGPTVAATSSQVAAGINYAWNQMGSHVINASWGYPESNAITAAINDALTYGRNGLGTVVVFAAGNPSFRTLGYYGPVAYPAKLTATTNVISVSAISRYGYAADYAPRNVGLIDVVAPSGATTQACVRGEVVTIDRYGAPGCNNGPNGDVHATTTASGTSSAAPQVAGVAALMLSYTPNLTAAQVKSILRTTADPWGDSQDFGAGKVNAFRAVRGY